MESSKGYLLVNFGGPRTLAEVEPFLRSLLTDQDVIRTQMPAFLHNLFFNRVAKKRTPQSSKQYQEIGGKSPIYEDTEAVAAALSQRLNTKVLTFHRYLPSTHQNTFDAIKALSVDEIFVFPMFPQFTYTTTGSIARLFYRTLAPNLLFKLRWVKSYPTHPAFIALIQKRIDLFLQSLGLREEEVILLFSAHGLPKKCIETGDIYEMECNASFHKVMEHFPKALGRLAYQSKFGPDEWLRPYTVDVCEEILGWNQGRKHVIFVPISFTSDHVETLFEIEKEYMPIIADQGIVAHRLPAFNQGEDWVSTIHDILQEENFVTTPMLIRWYN